MVEKKIIGRCCNCGADLGKVDVAITMHGESLDRYCVRCAEHLLNDAVVGAILKSISPKRYAEIADFGKHIGVILVAKE